MIPHSQNAKEVLNELKTDEVRGLTSAQVAENTEKYGVNKLDEKKKKNVRK